MLVKWIWKLVNKDEAMWSKLLERKYLKGRDFFSWKGQWGSQFWRGMQKVKHLFKWGLFIKMGMSNQQGSGQMCGWIRFLLILVNVSSI
jgi:hypothetical protein